MVYSGLEEHTIYTGCYCSTPRVVFSSHSRFTTRLCSMFMYGGIKEYSFLGGKVSCLRLTLAQNSEHQRKVLLSGRNYHPLLTSHPPKPWHDGSGMGKLNGYCTLALGLRREFQRGGSYITKNNIGLPPIPATSPVFTRNWNQIGQSIRYWIHALQD